MINITTIRKRMTKGMLLMLLFLAQTVISSAQVKLYLEDFSVSRADITSAEGKAVSLILDNNAVATQLQVTIDLPAGLEYVPNSAKKTDRIKSGDAYIDASTATGKLVIVGTDVNVAVGSGAVITFNVRPDATLKDGDHQIKLTEIVVSDENANLLNNVTASTSTVTMLSLGSCKMEAPAMLEAELNKEYQIDVTLNNEGVDNVAAVSGTVTVPAGLEIIAGEEGKFIRSDRAQSPLSFKVKEFDGYTNFVLSSNRNTVITGTDGVLFSFKVKADASLAAGAAIKLSDLRVADTDGKSAPMSDIEIKVVINKLSVAKYELSTAIEKVKAIETEGMEGADALAAAIRQAEAALNATTIDDVDAAKEALAQAVSVFNKANLADGLVEIAQSQGKDLDDFTRAELVEGEGYNTYTVNGDLNIAIKMMNIDVKGCDYVVIKFAEPVAAGWHLAFWSNQDLVDVPAGATEFKYVFADDPKCGVSADGVLPQICMMTFFGGFQAPLVAKVEGIYKHVEPVHTWNFTKWSEATVANLKADAAASKVVGWSDVEKKADAEAGNDAPEATKDNCFWAVIAEGGELTANGEVIEELKGLQFGATFAGNRSLAIAVNYPTTSLGTYAGPAYLWLGGKNFECFTIPAVKGGTTIKMGVESHKLTDARGVQLFAGETELKDAAGNAVAAPTTYTEQTWVVPAGVAYDIVVKNTNGCHIYFIDAEQDEQTLTSINTVKSSINDGVIYNLNGQKVSKALKGLFIINGKKVVIK
ncbi:hypothetical protein SAMN04487901_10271 [Prevotella communis]|uniref:Uncharacterized protein n=1 Tax=Prevotella communis TaxID=2913614 RepID=A0A1G7T0G2_9BACT|nr:hypothetical protein [Prevotella communis]SDG28632.1 hypothetical protein SAMN04487901_10271 [Prevotella communis]